MDKSFDLAFKPLRAVLKPLRVARRVPSRRERQHASAGRSAWARH